MKEEEEEESQEDESPESQERRVLSWDRCCCEVSLEED